MAPLAPIMAVRPGSRDRVSVILVILLLFALIVVAFLLFEPLGLFGVWLRIKRYFIAWPFRY